MPLFRCSGVPCASPAPTSAATIRPRSSMPTTWPMTCTISGTIARRSRSTRTRSPDGGATSATTIRTRSSLAKNLARNLFDLGEFDKARAMDDQVLARRRRVLGGRPRGHPQLRTQPGRRPARTGRTRPGPRSARGDAAPPPPHAGRGAPTKPCSVRAISPTTCAPRGNTGEPATCTRDVRSPPSAPTNPRRQPTSWPRFGSPAPTHRTAGQSWTGAAGQARRRPSRAGRHLGTDAVGRGMDRSHHPTRPPVRSADTRDMNAAGPDAGRVAAVPLRPDPREQVAGPARRPSWPDALRARERRQVAPGSRGSDAVTCGRGDLGGRVSASSPGWSSRPSPRRSGCPGRCSCFRPARPPACAQPRRDPDEPAVQRRSHARVPCSATSARTAWVGRLPASSSRPPCPASWSAP